MYCPNDMMKINRFVQVDIPKNIDYMSRFGSVTPNVNSYSGEEEIRRENTKVEDIERYAEYAEQMAREQAKKGQD